MRNNGFVPWSTARHGLVGRTDDFVCNRNSRNESFMDICGISVKPFAVCAVYFISGVMGDYDSDAGYMLHICEKESAWENKKYICLIKTKK